MLFCVQISLFWWRYLYCDVAKKALFVTCFNIGHYDVIKAELYCCNITEATLFVVMLLKQYYSSYGVLGSNCYGLKIIGLVLLVLENCQRTEAMLLVAVLLKQYYSSYRVLGSSFYGLKIIGLVLLVLENCQSNTTLLEYHWSKVILHKVVQVICPSMVLLNQTQRYLCRCYLV